MVGNWGLLGCGGASSGVDPSARECVKGAIGTQTVSLNPGRTLTSKEGTGAQEALSLRVSPALGPLAGCVCSGWGWAIPGWAAQRCEARGAALLGRWAA